MQIKSLHIDALVDHEKKNNRHFVTINGKKKSLPFSKFKLFTMLALARSSDLFSFDDVMPGVREGGWLNVKYWFAGESNHACDYAYELRQMLRQFFDIDPSFMEGDKKGSYRLIVLPEDISFDYRALYRLKDKDIAWLIPLKKLLR